jgi:REP element-mobilizing transposase RayT
MKFNQDIHHRRSIRLKGYDYTLPGAYFVTIDTWQREPLFGEVVGGDMQLNRLGRVVLQAWHDLPKHYPNVSLDAFCIMPNHIHGIIVLVDATTVQGLPEIVRALKSFSARRINHLRGSPGTPVWQRNYYEHILTNDDELGKARFYIINNPLKWQNNTDQP